MSQALWPEVRFSVGVHPHNAGRFAVNPADAASLTERGLAEQPRARAVGEIGLDYHYDHAPRQTQRGCSRSRSGWRKRAACRS